MTETEGMGTPKWLAAIYRDNFRQAYKPELPEEEKVSLWADFAPYLATGLEPAPEPS